MVKNRINNDVFKQIKLIVFILSVLFFPAKDEWYRYYIVFNIVLPSVLFFNYFNQPDVVTKRFYIWVGFIAVTTLLKGVFLPGTVSVTREFTELFRVLLIIPILLIPQDYFNQKTFKAFVYVVIGYFFLDFYVTLSEVGLISNNQYLSIIKSLYHSSAQENLNYLGKGLSSHAAEHGLFLNYFIIVLLCLMKDWKNKLVINALIILALLGLVASGSKTSMVAIVFILSVYYIISIMKEKIKFNFSFVIIIALLCIGTIWALNSGKFVRLEVLLTQGTNTSSYRAREDNWLFYLNILEEYYYMFPIGWGKSIFMIEGKSTFFTDNEYLTYLIIHGLIVLIIILYYLVIYLYRIFRNWTKANVQEKILFFVLIDFLFIGMASVSFSSPKIITLIFLLYKFSLYKSITFQTDKSKNVIT